MPSLLQKQSISSFRPRLTLFSSPLVEVVRVVFVVTLLVLGLVSPAQAFRTIDEIGGLESNEPIRWRHARMHFVEAGRHEDESPADVSLSELFSEASGAWSEPACGQPALFFGVEGSPNVLSGDAENSIQWSTAKVQEAVGGDAPAFADVQLTGSEELWEISEVDIYLDPKAEVWQDPDLARAALTHELGHAFGLLHPCETEGLGSGAPLCEETTEAGSLMHPILSSETSMVTEDDFDGLCFLYLGQNQASGGELGTGETCSAADDCISGHCLKSKGDASGVCTLECESNEECSDGLVCSEFGSGHFCAFNEEGGGGCAASPRHGSRSSSWLLGFLVGLLLWSRTRRRESERK